MYYPRVIEKAFEHLATTNGLDALMGFRVTPGQRKVEE